jgi:hypothetical protein
VEGSGGVRGRPRRYVGRGGLGDRTSTMMLSN